MADDPHKHDEFCIKLLDLCELLKGHAGKIIESNPVGAKDIMNAVDDYHYIFTVIALMNKIENAHPHIRDTHIIALAQHFDLQIEGRPMEDIRGEVKEKITVFKNNFNLKDEDLKSGYGIIVTNPKFAEYIATLTMLQILHDLPGTDEYKAPVQKPKGKVVSDYCQTVGITTQTNEMN